MREESKLVSLATWALFASRAGRIAETRVAVLGYFVQTTGAQLLQVDHPSPHSFQAVLEVDGLRLEVLADDAFEVTVRQAEGGPVLVNPYYQAHNGGPEDPEALRAILRLALECGRQRISATTTATTEGTAL